MIPKDDPSMSLIKRLSLAASASALVLSAGIAQSAAPTGDWTTTGGTGSMSKYSPLAQITPANVDRLSQKWTVDAGGGQVTPVAVGGVLYYPSGSMVFAVDGDTGAILWKTDLATLVALSDPNEAVNQARPAGFKAPRGGAPKQGFLALGGSAKYGLAYWPGMGKIAPRIVIATGTGYLVQLNAKDGTLVRNFGTNGALDLRVGVMENMNLSDYTPGALPTIYKNTVLVTPRTSENGRYGTPGDPRAFDLVTGKLVWRFHVVPHPGEENFGDWGMDGWQDRRGAGSWVPMSVDPANNLVFMATGNATDQDYGAQRPGNNLYATTILALDGDTGKLRWYFQTTHHDIYDWDINSAPTLVDMTDQSGAKVPAVVQSTKNGYMFVLNRLTGKPILPVVEKRIPPTDATGELASETQPVPLTTVARVSLTRDEVANLSPQSHDFCLKIYDNAVQMGEGTPYGMEASLVFPSSTGGANPAGVTFDPNSNTLFVNVQNLGTIAMLTPALSVGKYESLSKSKIPFVDEQGYPCSSPPWGEIMAVDAKSGAIKWREPLGEYKELTAKGIPPTGQVPAGGSIVTGGGVLFVGATPDKKFRAIDPSSGKLLWSAELRGAAGSTPLTYTGKSGKQYVAVVTSGGRTAGATGPGIGGNGGQLVSFALQ
jgi:glucose dehydrogenase